MKGISMNTVRYLKIFFALSISLSTFGFTQENRMPNDIRDNRQTAYALTHANIHSSSSSMIKDGMLLIKDDKIVNVVDNNKVPAGYTEINLAGRNIYPGLIEMRSRYGLPKPAKQKPFSWGGPEVVDSPDTRAVNVNQAIHAEYRASSEFKSDKKTAKKLRNLGFSTVLSYRNDGIARGTSTLVTIGDDNANKAIIKVDASAHYSFKKGSSTQTFPVSKMGSVALIRQTHLDAQWYIEQTSKPFTDHSLEAWASTQKMPQIFESSDWQTTLTADEIGDEFGVQYIIEGSGDEYRRLDLMKKTNASFIVPVNFPAPFDLDDPIDAKRVTLKEMKHWELAPYNLAKMSVAKIPFAITTKGAEGDFWKNMRLAVSNGLDKSTALAAITENPAKLLKVSSQVGSIKKGMLANFIVTSGELFDDKTVINENWIRGVKYQLNENKPDNSGNYTLNVGSDQYNVEISGEAGKHKAKFIADVPDTEKSVDKNTDSNADSHAKKHKGKQDKKNVLKLSIDGELISINYVPKDLSAAVRLTGWRNNNGWQGKGQLTDGSWTSWTLHFESILALKETEKENEKDDKANNDKEKTIAKITYPLTAYGYENSPKAQTILIKNATVWTNEKEGILQNTDVLVSKGKISKIGKNITSRKALVIDGSGMHLTPGIVDEHSHVALAGANDVATNSGMVRVKDVINSEHVGIYRNLAGGVTTAQLLHGSANPVGGQSALVKMRWGKSANELMIKGADKFIKFALGENVKRSSNSKSIRYPQTRMGVEQVYKDAFSQALQYEKDLKTYDDLSRSKKKITGAPRRDLVHETMLEIINGERFVSCHSYVQSEINMLMNVADEYGFNINTFTHILEGYKVADKMAKHGAGGSTFSDWWAYKWEVRYAIPYNVALMKQAGVVTAINSDDAEMGRRLNTEAAKTIKYGGLSEEDALKLVTLNPAKLLHLDKQIGSIKKGKDADLVLWTENPLSIYTKASKTLVDGILYFDLDADIKAREAIKAERARLTQKIRTAKKGHKGKSSKPAPTMMEHRHDIDISQFQHDDSSINTAAK
jgi:imidazolonepropionase-like amidohydrolase